MDEVQLRRWWCDVLAALVREELLTAEEAEVAELRITEDATLRPTPRNYAATSVGILGRPWGPVDVHRDLLKLSSRKVLAVLLHELGHVLDGTGRYREGAPEDEEQRADWMIRELLGVEISYDPKDMVQVLGGGISRPAGLR